MNYNFTIIRPEAVLTTGYVAGNIIGTDQILSLEKNNQGVLYVDFTKGSLTTAEVKLDFAGKLYYDLAYDTQTANFTVGKIVTGASSGAKGLIVFDTDLGATGTLVIEPINKLNFIDDEIITDDNTVAGSATVNGAMSYADSSIAEKTWFQETVTTIVPSLLTETAVYHQFAASGRYRLALPLKDKYIRISAKGTGTVTNSLMGINAVIGVV